MYPLNCFLFFPETSPPPLIESAHGDTTWILVTVIIVLFTVILLLVVFVWIVKKEEMYRLKGGNKLQNGKIVDDETGNVHNNDPSTPESFTNQLSREESHSGDKFHLKK